MTNGQAVTQFLDKSEVMSRSYFSSVEKVNSTIPLKEISAFNTDVRLKEDSASGVMDKKALHCFGQKIEVGFSLDDGVWTKIEGGSLWCLDLTSAQAIGMNVGFENLYIPEGAELYVVNADQTMVYGPVTSSNVPENHILLTEFLDGERIRIYLYEPDNQKSKSQLHITSVGHAFSATETRGETLLPCHNDVMCYSSWQRESDAIVKIEFPKDGWYYSATGALVMNTRKDFKPYILAAFHSLDKNQDNDLSEDEINAVSQCIFTFKYKKNACNGTVGSVITFNGAKFRAAWLKTDMTLLELNGVILSDHNLSFLGWDRSGKNSSGGTCIHHPLGRDMKISFSNQSVSVFNKRLDWKKDNDIVYYTSEPGMHWECIMENGSLQDRSSGAPLLNSQGRVIGQLHGGKDICPPVSKYFGRFDLSWEGGGTPATQLKHWLDPDNTGAVTMNTQYKEWFISGPNGSNVANNTVFTVKGLPEDATVSWSISFPPFFALSQVDNQSVKVTPYKYEVSATLVAIISQNGRALDRLTKTVTSLPLSISGDKYVSGLLSTCNIHYLPEGGTLTWRCSDGIDIESYDGTKINFKGCNVKEPWLEAVVTDTDGNESIVRHNLNIATVVSAELTLLKTWYADNSDGANVKKYAYRVDFKPDIPSEHLNFCWRNSVAVKYKDSDRPHLNIADGAKMRTAGDISCRYTAGSIDTSLISKPSIVMPFASPTPGAIPDYPLIIEQSIWSQTRDHVIVEMPVIDLNETAEGYLTCTIQDYCENSATATSKEVLFTQWNYVYHAAPNPANNVITISRMIEGNVRNTNIFSMSVPETITANLYNSNTLVRSFKFNSTQGNADMHVGDLPEGNYYLNILEGGKVVGSQVVLIQR